VEKRKIEKNLVIIDQIIGSKNVKTHNSKDDFNHFNALTSSYAIAIATLSK
jgi:hypothetical protein